MAKRIVIGAYLTNRLQEASAFQELITQYGCNIKARIGLHEVSDGLCSTGGLILLDMIGDESRILELEDRLRLIEGIKVQKLVFEE
jgi:hypothetical protein